MIRTKHTVAFTVLSFVAASAHTSIEEVLVSSQKRDQAIVEIPFSVTAVDATQLEQLNIVDLRQLKALSPGLYISNDDPTRSSYTVRGINSGVPSAQAAPRVAIYLNEADISRNRSSQIELHDLERIEIIKGPQSTLFGTTASAGAIAYYTQPASSKTESKISASFGNYGLFDVRAVANGGTESLRGRLALLSRKRDGFAQNLEPGADYGSINRLSIRPSIRWIMNDTWTADLVFTYETSGDTVSPNKSGVISPPGGDTSPFSGQVQSGSEATSPLFPRNTLTVDRSTHDANLRIEGALGDWGFTSITAYRDFDSATPMDADGSQAYAFELLEQASGQQFSQEFRGQYSADELTLTTSLSYVDEGNRRSNSFSADEGSYIMCVPLARQTFSQVYNQFALLSPTVAQLAAIVDPATGLPCSNADGSINSLTPIQTNGALQSLPYFANLKDFGNNQSLSALVDIGYAINDKLYTDIGLRYIKEDRESAYRATVPTAVLLQNLLPLLTLGDTAGNTLSDSSSDNDILIRASGRYQWADNHYIYLGYSEGRRSEVVDITSALDSNFNTTQSINRIPAEKLENIELGFKGNTGQLKYSAALFYQRYQNFQVSFLNPNGQFVVANAGDTSNPGAELELAWQLNDHIELFGNAGVIDQSIDRDAANGLFAGKDLENVSETTGTLGINYSRDINSKEIKASLYAHYRSEFATDSQRQPADPISGLALRQKAHTLIDGSISLNSPSDGWQFTLWGQNLSDKQYLSDISDIGANIGLPTYITAPPRTWGITVSAYQ